MYRFCHTSCCFIYWWGPVRCCSREGVPDLESHSFRNGYVGNVRIVIIPCVSKPVRSVTGKGKRGGNIVSSPVSARKFGY